MIPLFHLLALASLGLALLVISRPALRATSLGVAGLLLGLSGMLWLLGFRVLAALACAGALVVLFRPPATSPAAATRSWHGAAIPILVASALGLAAPTLWDAAIDVHALPPPVEGSSAARGGAGLRFALLDRGVLLSAATLAVVLLAFLARRAITKLGVES